MKSTVVLMAAMFAIAMAVPAGALAAESCPCASPAVSMHKTAPMTTKANIARRIERADVREAESHKDWNSTFPTLGFYWGRMAPRNSRLFG